MFRLHQNRNFSWEDIGNLYPFELDIICIFIEQDNEKEKSKKSLGNRSIQDIMKYGYENAT